MSISASAFGDHLLIPQAAVLIVEQHQRAVGVEARRRAGVLQQQQRRQSHDLGLALEQPQQQPRQANGLLAQGPADLGGVAAGRIALVEDQVDHRGDRGEPLGALHRARGLERHVGVRDAGLGAGDALLHRRLADQEGARDLLHRQAGDDAQRERDLLGCRQFGMAADEQQPQDVVAVMRAVEPFGELLLGVVEVGDRLVLGQRLLLAVAPHLVDRDVAPDHDQPRRGIARRTVLRPALQRAQARVLERFLGGVEIAEIAQQRADRLGTRRGQRGIDPGGVGHLVTLSGLIQPDGPDLVGAAGIGRAEIARDVDRLVEIVAVDEVEPEQLLLGLGIGTVEHDRRIVLAQRGRRCRRQQPRHRPEPALFGQSVLHDGELLASPRRPAPWSRSRRGLRRDSKGWRTACEGVPV